MPAASRSRRRPTRTPRWRRALLLLATAGVVAACSGGERPELVDQAPPTPSPTAVPTVAADPTPTAEESTPTDTPATPTPEVVASTRGVTDDTILVGVVGTERVFPGHADAVAARLARVARNGGIDGRQVEISRSIDDGGDPDAHLAALRELVETDGVFAVVIASVAATPESIEYLEAQQVPHTQWGFGGGVCAPYRWGFGFSGCLDGFALGVDGAEPSPVWRAPLEALVPEIDEPTVVLVAGTGRAGEAARVTIEGAWGDRLVGSVAVGADADLGAVVEEIRATPSDLVLLRVRLETAADLKAALRAAGETRPVVDDAGYLPGLLADIPIATRLEGGYSLSQLPPQEGLRDATLRLAFDLQEIGAAGADPANLQLSQGHQVGYWSTDLLVALLDGVEGPLDTATFLAAADAGVAYDPGLDGGPCPASSADLRVAPAGGAAIVSVVGGIYREVVPWSC